MTHSEAYISRHVTISIDDGNVSGNIFSLYFFFLFGARGKAKKSGKETNDQMKKKTESKIKLFYSRLHAFVHFAS